MPAAAEKSWTAAEYLEFERRSEIRHEFFGGEIFALSGASLKHNRIVRNVLAALHRQLGGRGCEAFASDLRVKVSATGLYTYPDVVVVCGEPLLDDDQLDTLLNPVLIVEVLSPSTQDYDRGTKFEHYRTIETFSEYLLIAQARPHVEHYVRRPDDTWLLSETKEARDVLILSSIDCRLPLVDVYSDLAGD